MMEQLHGWLEAQLAEREDRAQLRVGQGDLLSAESLAER